MATRSTRAWCSSACSVQISSCSPPQFLVRRSPPHPTSPHKFRAAAQNVLCYAMLRAQPKPCKDGAPLQASSRAAAARPCAAASRARCAWRTTRPSTRRRSLYTPPRLPRCCRCGCTRQRARRCSRGCSRRCSRCRRCSFSSSGRARAGSSIRCSAATAAVRPLLRLSRPAPAHTPYSQVASCVELLAHHLSRLCTCGTTRA